MTCRFKLPSRVSALTFGHDSASNLIVHAIGSAGEEEYLVNKIGDYQGSRPLFSEEDTEWILEVDADGFWTINVMSAQLAPAPITALQGSGAIGSDLFEPEAEEQVVYEFTHDGESNFIVHLICAGGEEFVQNEIGKVDGAAVVNFTAGPCMWDVDADGDWTIKQRE